MGEAQNLNVTNQADDTINIKTPPTPLDPVKGDGTDETAKLQAIISYASNKSKIIIPSGTYNTSESINIPSNSVIEFVNAKIINNTDNTIFVHKSDSFNSNIEIINANLEGKATSNLQTAIDMEGCDNVTITGCNITQFAEFGIYLRNCTNSLIERNTVTHCSFTSSPTNKKAILIWSCDNCNIVQNIVTNNGGEGISLLASRKTPCDNNKILYNKCWYNSNTGIIGAGAIYENLLVEGNSCCYNGTVRTAGPDGGINFHGCKLSKIINNTCSYNNNYGIDLNGNPSGFDTTRTFQTIVTGNTCYGNKNVGIIIFNCTNMELSGNEVSKNYQNILLSGTTYTNITNNECYDDTRGIGNIYLYGSCDNILIENNKLGSNETTDKTPAVRQEATCTNIVIGYNNTAKTLTTDYVYMLLNLNNVTFKQAKRVMSREFVLNSAKPDYDILAYVTKNSRILGISVFYTEATGSDSGVPFTIGTLTNPSRYYSGVTASNKGIASLDKISPIGYNQRLLANDPVYIYCANGKTGTGKVKFIIDYVEEQIYPD